MAEESSEWRIDALDARGGLAFASRKPALFSELDDRSQDPVCAFVGAPGFQPEMVANRSIALAGIRGSFQYRLFIEGDEVAFPTLAAVTEFVRRVYLRGGGGDGAGGAGGEGPILPVDRPDLPERPDLDGESGGLARAMVGAVAAFKRASESCAKFYPSGKEGSASEFRDWPRLHVQEPGKPITDGPTTLANAAIRLIYEMMRRIPNGRNPVATARWHRDARTLGSMIAAMGLWDILWREPYQRSLIRLIRGLNSWKSELTALQVATGDDVIDLRFLSAVIFGYGPALDDKASAMAYLETLYHWRGPFSDGVLSWQRWSRDGRAVDPVANLRRIPLPKDAAAVVRKAPGDEVSLYHTLVSIAGAPLLADSQRPDFFELVLFAATWIVVCNDAPTSSFISGYTPAPLSSVRTAEVQIKLVRGSNWLKANLPAMCFAPKVEEAINTAADLKYELGAAPPPGTAA